MNGNESDCALLVIAVQTVFGVICGVFGYWMRGRIDSSNKKKDASFDDRREAAKKMLPAIDEFVRLSECLCEGHVSSSESTLDGCIHAYKKNVENLFRLWKELNEEFDQSMHFFDKSTGEKAKVLISLLSSEMPKLVKVFEVAEHLREEGGDEVLRIMKCGVNDYCDKCSREISSAMSAVKGGVKKDLA